jgi:hypothetical protein
MAQSIQTSKFGTLDTSGRVPFYLTGEDSDPLKATLGATFTINGKEYGFIPEDRVTKGAASGNFGQVLVGFLNPTLLSEFKNNSDYVDLANTQFGNFDAGNYISKELGASTKGYIAPIENFASFLNAGTATYDPTLTGEIKGIGNYQGQPVFYGDNGYVEPSGKYNYRQTIGQQIIGYTYSGGGGVLADLGNAILKAGPIAPLALDIVGTAFGVPGIGTAVALGTAGGLAATGKPEAALGYGATALVGQLGVGSTVAEATGSTLAGQVAQGTTAGLLTGKNPETALTSGVVGAGAGLAGSTVAGETGSAVAGQVAAGTTAGVLSGKTVEQSLAQGVGNIKLDSLIPDSGVTVANEAQVTAGQTALQDSLAPFLKDTTASAFDTKDIIDDNSGFSTTTTAPITIDSGVINPAQTVANVVGTDATTTEAVTNLNQNLISSAGTEATKIDTTQTTVNTGVKTMGDDDEVIDFEGAGMSADLREYLADPEGATMYKDIQRELNLDPEGAGMSADLAKAIDDYSKGTGLTLDKVIKLFKSNPNLVKSATSLVTGGVGLFGTKLATDTAREAARVAAEAQKFKPVGVTTRFGTTDYKYDAEGNLTSAGYTLTPDLKAIQDKLMSGATLSLDEAKKVSDLYDPLKKASTSLFDLGTSYLAKTPEQVASDYMAKQQDLLAPSRERQMSQLQNTLFQQGRGGLSVGATSARPSGARGLGATTPEMEAYYNALAQQDAALAAGAQQAGQQSVLFGKGLLGAGGEFLGKYTAGQAGAYDPFKTLLSTAGAVESMGAGALDVGTALGGRTTTASSNAARTLLPTSSVNPYSSLFLSLADDPSFKTALQDFISGGSSGTNYGTASRANDVNTPF